MELYTATAKRNHFKSVKVRNLVVIDMVAPRANCLDRLVGNVAFGLVDWIYGLIENKSTRVGPLAESTIGEFSFSISILELMGAETLRSGCE